MNEEEKEKLKEQLKASMSKDHFKEHRSEEKKEENTAKEPEENKSLTPNLEEINLSGNLKKQENIEKKNNLTVPMLISIVLILIIAIVYLFYKQNEIINNFTQKEITIKEELKTLQENINISKEEDNNKETPKETKEEPILVKEESVSINSEKNIDTEEKIEELKPIIQEVIKVEKIVKELVNVDNFKEFYNSSKFVELKCYDYEIASILPSSKCKKELTLFLEKNKNSLRFEIIPVIDENEKELFKNFDYIKLDNIPKSTNLKRFVLRGLSRERVLEISWELKQKLGKDIILTPTNYYVESRAENRGVIVRAYYNK